MIAVVPCYDPNTQKVKKRQHSKPLINMQSLFTPEYRWLWTFVLMAALFLPVRRFIWILTVRRAVEKAGEDAVDDAERGRLLRRAGISAGLLCFVFSYFYVHTLFK